MLQTIKSLQIGPKRGVGASESHPTPMMILTGIRLEILTMTQNVISLLVDDLRTGGGLADRLLADHIRDRVAKVRSWKVRGPG